MSLLFWRKKKEELPPGTFTTRQDVIGFVGGVHMKKLPLIESEKKIKKFLTHKFRTSRSMDKPEKLATAIYKWLVHNL